MNVRPKKHLGQHFLTDKNVAKDIADSVTLNGYSTVVEIGPGMGMLTQFLLPRPAIDLYVYEIDYESVDYLKREFLELQGKIIEGDFLREKLDQRFTEPLCIAGNFPYNISSQIIFKAIEYRNLVVELTGMFQKEVAERIAEKPGSKQYGIISVLVQAFYDVEYLFTVSPDVFNPPPKVNSGVIRLTRNERRSLPCDEKKFIQVVKMGFNQRRKTLRNSLKPLVNAAEIDSSLEILAQRPEQLSVEEFIKLTQLLHPK